MHLLKKIFLIISIPFILIGCYHSDSINGDTYKISNEYITKLKTYEGKRILDFLKTYSTENWHLRKAQTYPFLQYASDGIYSTDSYSQYYRIYVLLDSVGENIHQIMLIGNNYTIY